MTTKQSQPYKQWVKEAACTGADEDLFFGESGANATFAIKYFCKECPVRIDCKWFAIENQYLGVYGGMTTAHRNKIAKAFFIPRAAST